MGKKKRQSKAQTQKRPYGVVDVLRRDQLTAELEQIARDQTVRGVLFFVVRGEDSIEIKSAGLTPLEADGVLARLEERHD